MMHYYECVTLSDGFYGWKVYHYDDSGNVEIIDAKGGPHSSKAFAYDAAVQWLEDNNIEAEMV